MFIVTMFIIIIITITITIVIIIACSLIHSFIHSCYIWLEHKLPGNRLPRILPTD